FRESNQVLDWHARFFRASTRPAPPFRHFIDLLDQSLRRRPVLRRQTSAHCSSLGIVILHSFLVSGRARNYSFFEPDDSGDRKDRRRPIRCACPHSSSRRTGPAWGISKSDGRTFGGIRQRAKALSR